MGYGHSLDLRERIIDAVAGGSPSRAAGRRFGVSASGAVMLVRRWRGTGSYAPGQVGGQKRRRLAGHYGWLHEGMAAQPDITLKELRAPCRDGCADPLPKHQRHAPGARLPV